MAALALLGSGEFLPWALDVDRWLAVNATAPSERALIIPTASAPEGTDVFERWSEMGLAHYRAIGLAPEIVPLRTRADADDPACVDMVADARIVFFSGGNPGYLAETLRGTAFWRAILSAVDDGTAFGGCSAGAVAPGALAPYVAHDALERWVPGLGMLANAFVIPHFDAIDRYGGPGFRRMLIDQCPEGAALVGIDEDTALVGSDGDWTVMGAGAAWFVAAEEPTPVASGERVPATLGLTLHSPA